ncbi:PF20097 family protein [Peptostreptococcaceae bacterium AGR-M142]
MECPYCKNMMESGVIQGERGDLNWYSDKDTTNSFFRSMGFGGQKISTTNFMSPKIKSYRCTECKKIIIDLDKKL